MLLNPFLLEKAFIQTRKEVPRDLGVKMKNRRHNALKKAFERLIENPYIDSLLSGIVFANKNSEA